MGFWSVLVEPSPKSQSHEVGFPVEVSVNWIAAGALALGLLLAGSATKEATGAEDCEKLSMDERNSVKEQDKTTNKPIPLFTILSPLSSYEKQK